MPLSIRLEGNVTSKVPPSVPAVTKSPVHLRQPSRLLLCRSYHWVLRLSMIAMRWLPVVGLGRLADRQLISLLNGSNATL